MNNPSRELSQCAITFYTFLNMTDTPNSSATMYLNTENKAYDVNLVLNCLLGGSDGN